jgi:uncharacterized protein (DUF952 family)
MRTLFVLIGILLSSLSFSDTPPSPPQFLYKVLSQSQWEQSRDQAFLVLPAMDCPFIHLSTEEQADKVVQKFFAKETRVFLLKLDVQKLPGRLLKERNPGGSDLYYHLYDGYIPTHAIVDVSRVK